MVSGNFRAHIDQRIFGDAEFMNARFGLHFGLAEMPALRLGDILRLGNARADLNRDIAVTVGGALRNHLVVLKCENGHGNVPPILLKQTGHTHLLCNHSGPHDHAPHVRGARRTVPRALGFARCLKRPRPGIFSREREDEDAAGASSAVSLISSLTNHAIRQRSAAIRPALSRRQRQRPDRASSKRRPSAVLAG